MRRFTSIVFLFVSLLCLLAVTAMWIRSYFRQEWIALAIRFPVPRLFTLGSFPGRLDLGFDQETTPPPPQPDLSLPPFSAYPRWTTYSDHVPRLPPSLSIHSYYLPQGVPMHQFLGFVWVNHSPAPLPGNCSYSLMIPYLYLLVLFAILPLRTAYHLRLKHRRLYRLKHRLCSTCGYDLRAHAPGDKCPECGTLVPPVTKPTSSA